jgi:PAS domain S-box-containing protein
MPNPDTAGPSVTRILLLEDSPADAALMQVSLAEDSVSQFDVTCVTRLSEATHQLGIATYDAMLLDLTVPDSTGINTVKVCHAASPRTPIIVLTGMGDVAVAVEALREGAQDYLVKGEAQGSQLDRAIRYAMERQRLEEERRHLLVEANTQRRLAQERADQLGAIFAAQADPVIIYDARGHVARVNPAAVATFGFDPVGLARTELASRLSMSRSDGTPVSISDLPSTRALRGETITGERFSCRNVAGTDLVMLAVASPVLRDGQVTGAVAVWHDITEQDRLERQLADEHARLETAMHHLPLGVIVVEADSGKISVLSQQNSTAWGHDPGSFDLARVSQIPLFHRDGRPYEPHERPIARSFRTCETVVNEEVDFVFDERTRGTLIVNTMPLRNSDGRTSAVLCTFQDITASRRERESLGRMKDILELRVQQRTADLARTVAALRDSQHFAQRVVETTPLMVWIYDLKEQQAVYVNGYCATITGYSADQMYRLGPSLMDVLTHPDERMTVNEWLSRVQRSRDGETVEVTHRLKRADGAWRWVYSRSTVFSRAEDRTARQVLITLRDITERTLLEQHARVTNSLMDLFARKSTRKEYLDAVTQVIQDWTGCECVGIRVVDSQGSIPYESYVGFTPEFWQIENWLSLEHDHCACTRVIAGKPEPQDKPVLTPGGSFLCGNIAAFVQDLPEQERARFRGGCVRAGYASLAVVPISYRGNTLGGLHIADKRPGVLTPEGIEFIERIAILIGEAVFRFNTEEEVWRNLQATKVINAVLAEGHRGLPLPDILRTAAERISEVPFFKVAPAVGVYLVGKKPSVLELVAEHRLSAAVRERCARVPFGKCLCGRAAQTGQPQFSPAGAAPKDCEEEYLASHAHYCAPISSDGAVLGALDLHLEMGHRPSETEQGFLTALSNALASVIIEIGASEQLAAERQRLFALLNELPGFVCLLGPGHTVPYANARFRDLFGDPGGRKCHEVMGGRSSPCAVCRSFNVLKTRRSEQWEWVGPNGRTYDVYDYPFQDADGSWVVLELGLDVSDRKRLEKELLEAGTREMQRIGHDLHDGVGQTLTGVTFLTDLLHQRLSAQSRPEAADAGRIADLIRQAAIQTRALSHGLSPVPLTEDGLMTALEQLAGDMTATGAAKCSFRFNAPTLVNNIGAATHLYYIAHEAVYNAVKHGKASRVIISLMNHRGRVTLVVRNDGQSFVDPSPDRIGLGLRTMAHRAKMIGGKLTVRGARHGGTLVYCSFTPEGMVAEGQGT